MKKKISSAKILLFVFVGVLSVAFVGPGAYALYQNSYDVEVITRTGELVCDVSIETNDAFIENNEVYFYVYVNNFETNGNTTVLTSTDITYDLIIENKNGSEALYRYLAEDGSTNEKGESVATIANQEMSKSSKTTKKYKVYVTTDAESRMNIDFNVKLDAKQKVMEQVN